MDFKGSSRAVEPEGNGATWKTVVLPTFVGALPAASVTGGFAIQHMWIGGAPRIHDDEGDMDETEAILADHPDVLQRLARLRASGSRGRPLSEVAADLGIAD